MENSETSKGCKSIPPKAKDCSDNEESGWTSYLEDFLSDSKNEHNSSLSSGYQSPNSLVSDSASFVGKRLVDKKGKKSLSLKKRMKTKGALVDFDGHDQALQDTASSTANSLKEKSNSTSGTQTNERSEGCLGMVGKPDNEYSTELKKKGLWR